MDAELCRMLARAQNSACYRREGATFVASSGIELGDRNLAEWLRDECLKAYVIDKLQPLVKGFLMDCDRSWQIEQEMFAGKPAGNRDDRDRQVMERLEQEQAV